MCLVATCSLVMNGVSEKEAVLAAINSVITLNREAGVSVDSLANMLRIASEERTKVLFVKFCKDIASCIHHCFQHFSSVMPSLAKVRAHREFHQKRLQEIPTIWKSFTSAAGVNDMEPLNLQAVSRHMFDSCMKHFFEMLRVSATAGTSRPNKQLLADEENVLRYASGCVVLKLYKIFKTPTQTMASIRNAQIMECISQMSNRDEDSPSSTYTLKWTESVNRGKLLVVNDSTFALFKAIEIETRQVLPMHLTEHTAAPSKKAEIIKTIVEDKMVQLRWQSVGKTIIDDDSSQELLRMLVDIWVTMRGFALTSKWIAEYKEDKEKALRKSKSLRKELKDNQ